MMGRVTKGMNLTAVVSWGLHGIPMRERWVLDRPQLVHEA